MLLSESITKIRRLIRDTTSKVFSDTSIIRVWNETQKFFCTETGLLEGYTWLQVPPTTEYTYTFRWEKDFAGKPSTLLYDELHGYSFTQPWEASQLLNVTPNVVGGTTITYGWEAYYDSPQNRIPHYFPENFSSLIFAGYDKQPVDIVFPEDIRSPHNNAWKTRTGSRPMLYIEDLTSNVFYLYPAVIDRWGLSQLNSDYGVITYDSDGDLTPTTDYGVITYIPNDDLDSDYGIVIYYVPKDNTLYIHYKREPMTLSSSSQTIDLPNWAIKYVEFGVLSKLLSMETDLQDLVLAQHYNERFKIGIQETTKLISNMKSMQAIKLDGIGQSERYGRKLPDLPSNYPSYWR